MKRTRANPDGVQECTRHILPLNEAMIRGIAAQKGCRSSEILVRLYAGLPQAVHPMFDLEYADVVSLTLSADQRHARAKLAKSDTVSVTQERSRDDFLLACILHETGAPPVGEPVASTVDELALVLNRARQAAVEAVKPAFRLASAILSSEDQLPFWHGIQRAGKRAERSSSAPDRIPTFVTKTDFTAEDQAITLGFLRELGQGIFISFCDTGNDCGRMYLPYDLDPNSYWGCHWRSEPRLWQDRRPRFARVELSVYDYLLPLLRWRELTATQLRRTYLALAVTMLHELAHVAAGHAFRRSPNETARAGDIYFRGALVAEVGWSYESYTFGGGVDIPVSESDPSRLFDWPCPQALQSYQSRGCCAPRKDLFSLIGSPGNVSVDAVNRSFCKTFWEAKACDNPSVAFRLNRCCGVYLYGEDGSSLDDQEDIQRRRLLKKRKLGL
nr:hypothetical protein B0A51_04882 [Rachicladosporium sp. CCFEE 5018]